MIFQGRELNVFEFLFVFVIVFWYYKVNWMCVVGFDYDIEWLEGSNMLDYELEFGIIVGKQGKNILYEWVRDYIFGYMIFNDVFVCDLQVEEMVVGLGLVKGKDFDVGNVFGFCIVIKDEVDIDNFIMIVWLNGEEVFKGNLSQMDYKVDDIIVYVS